MRYKVRRTDEGYIAEQGDDVFTTVEHQEMVDELIKRGEHPIDVHDFVRAADRKWLREHPDEPDPDAAFDIARVWNGDGYVATTNTRVTSWRSTEHGLTSRDEIREAVIAQGFPEADVDARLDEIDRAMAEDRKYNRMALGGFVVARFGDGYRTRNIGEYNWWPPHGSVSSDRLRQRFHEYFLTDDAKIDALIERADREAAAAEGGAL